MNNNFKNHIVLKPNAKKFYNHCNEPPVTEIYNETVPISNEIIRVFIRDECIYIDFDGSVEYYSKDSIHNRKKAFKSADELYVDRKKFAENDSYLDCDDEDWQNYVENCIND